MDRDTNHILLCRTLAYSDIEVELLNYDEDLLSRSIAVKDFAAKLTAIVPLTHDIFRLEMEVPQPLKFWAGQYVDITVPGKGITRSFSMANPPSEPNRLQFIIKKYGQGAFSSLLDGGLKVGDSLMLRGPYGTCLRRENRTGPLVLVRWLTACRRCGRSFRTRSAAENRRVRSASSTGRVRPATSSISIVSPNWRKSCPTSSSSRRCLMRLRRCLDGRNRLHPSKIIRAHLPDMGDAADIDVYSCGPPPMIDALLPVLQIAGIEPGPDLLRQVHARSSIVLQKPRGGKQK